MRGIAHIVLVVMVVASLAAPAAAQPGTAAAAPPGTPGATVTRTKSYRKLVGASDGVALGLFGVAVVAAVVSAGESAWPGGSEGEESGELVVGLLAASGIVYLAGAPLVHLAQGNPGGAVKSLAVRVGAPAALFALGYAIGPQGNCDDGGPCTRSEAGARLALLGLLIAVVVDQVAFAKVDVVGPAPGPAPYAQATASGGLVLGLAGRY